MKFFTRQWHAGHLSDREADKVVQAYDDHLESLLPHLPVSLLALAKNTNLHDGRIRQVSVDRVAATVTLGVRCGDRQFGYFDVDLIYEHVDFTNSELSEMKAIAQDPRAEVLYDEVDTNVHNRWVHRILFWPYRELCVEFRKLDLRVESRDTREFTRSPNVYTEFS